MANMVEAVKFNRSIADAGATELDFQLSESLMALLHGVPTDVCMNALVNSVAIVIAERNQSETNAMQEAVNFRKSVERCIRINWPDIEKSRSMGATK